MRSSYAGLLSDYCIHEVSLPWSLDFWCYTRKYFYVFLLPRSALSKVVMLPSSLLQYFYQWSGAASHSGLYNFLDCINWFNWFVSPHSQFHRQGRWWGYFFRSGCFFLRPNIILLHKTEEKPPKGKFVSTVLNSIVYIQSKEVILLLFLVLMWPYLRYCIHLPIIKRLCTSLKMPRGGQQSRFGQMAHAVWRG